MVEMMFAILIFSIVLLGLLGVLSSLLRHQAEGRAYEQVSVAANSLFGLAGEALAEDFDRPLVPDVFPAGRQSVPNLEGITFELVETAERADLKRVDLSLYWRDRQNVEHHKSMSTRFLNEK